MKNYETTNNGRNNVAVFLSVIMITNKVSHTSVNMTNDTQAPC